MSFDYERRGGFIYFIQESELRNIKIGFTSSHPEKRLRSLACGNSQELKIIGLKIDSKPLEAKLHKRFGDLHVRNEWYRPGEELMAYIDRLEYGSAFEEELQQFVKVPGR
ncbi:GIY-YIG nuclease family protein [Thiopseudomonas denitrificans]|uniref:T5orf172 domain-containing protein n=1 Tax=Thiopseudomonas denitrificans TaxID=1501432 RepID=A0A4R6TXW3_9GAMM|nr:GIY-YIG nuclease family protein [Thiopseudomonas denitrificans]TDQ34643.1 T5orf172 domain-containing protein [Thiopseudomonas denitrificans]